MKKIYCYFLGIMLAAGFSACTSENEFAKDFAEPAKVFKVSIPATYIDADTRAVELTDDGNYLKAYFKEGDKIRVFRSDYNYYSWNQRDLVTIGSTGTTTTLTGTLTSKYKAGDELLLSYENPENLYNSFPSFSYGVQEGTFENASKWDFAFAKVKVVSVDTSAGILKTEPANFKSSQSYFILSFVDKENNPVKAKSVRIESSKILASAIYPSKNSDDYFFENYRVFLEKPSSDVWVVMTVYEKATEDEEITFIVEGEDGTLYKGTKKASVGDSDGKIKNGKFYSSTIELEATEIVNTLVLEGPKGAFELDGLTYMIKDNVSVSGKSYLAYNLSVASPDIAITFDNVDITKDGAVFSNYYDNVIINLGGDNYMTNTRVNAGGFNLHPNHGSLTFKGTGTLVLNNCDFNPLDYLNVTYEDGLVATYDPVTKTTTIAPINENAGIIFEDENVKDVCLSYWDSNDDGVISYGEAAAVTDLGTAFKGNTTIKRFTELRFFSGLTSISESAFEGCAALELVALPNTGITSIDKNAFKGAIALSRFTFPPTVTKIGESAFEGCTALTGRGADVCSFPKSVAEIGAYAFKDCTSLAGLEFRAKDVIIGTSAFENTYLRSNSVYFDYTSNGTIQFKEKAFYGSKLGSVTMNAATTISFGAEVFANCENLYVISMRSATTPPAFGENMFKDCTRLGTEVGSTWGIIVPAASADNYKAADGWKDYKDIIFGK